MAGNRDTSMSDNGVVDWNDPMFGSTQFDDAMPADSPYGTTSAFDNYTNLNDFADSPGGLIMRSTTKPPLDFASTPSHHNHIMTTSRSAESSSQDSASDTSSSRKRKTTSESPASDAHENDKSRLVMKGETLVDMGERRKIKARSNNPSRRTSKSMPGQQMFDFSSAASSPINPGAFDAALSLDEQVHGIMMPQGNNMNMNAFNHTSPLQTINPATFNNSPVHANMMLNNTSPHALFSTPSADNMDSMSAASQWTANAGQNPAWQAEFTHTTFNSPGALHFTPSPTNVAHSNSHSGSSGGRSSRRAERSKLHIGTISAKSRVETQITIVMTLETPPKGVDFLHLPLHTIAKSKLLAKDDVEPNKVLELHTMLVCTSAMKNPALKTKALRRAAAQNNNQIQLHGIAQKSVKDEDKNDPKKVADDDKPASGGEVRICSNCIQRERKRAARKKLKKEEEQQHWERYETERVVVFNSNELLPFKPWERQIASKDVPEDPYIGPDGAIQVSAQMRIACYCRHQNEKEGFQVIFTMKDKAGNVVAQDMSESILITDDHKTHQPSFAGQMPDQLPFTGPPPMYGAPGLPTSYSMVDMSQHVQQGFTSSRSTGNLQGLAYGSQYPQSHVHQMQNPGYTSQTTSATMTPTNSLSRPGSPTSAGHSGPNKKRKSSSFHRKVPSGLAMTPRVDTTVQQTSSANPSAISMTSQFSPMTPSGVAYGQPDQGYMNMGGAANGQYLHSGPPTPGENLQYAAQQLAQGVHARGNNQQVPDYYQSLPGSRVTSRAPSPVSSRPNMAAYARQQAQPGSARGQNYPQAASAESEGVLLPMIHKITPTEGPVTGGTEVSIYGRDFLQGMQVYFGDQPATAITFYGEQALLCTSPPGRVGGVQVTVLPVGHVPQYNPSQANRPIFTYKNANEKVMEMALRFVSQQQTGNPNSWWQVTQNNAQRWMAQNVNRTGFSPTGYEGNVLASQPAMLETAIKSLLQTYDADDRDAACLDIPLVAGGTPLTLACAAGLQESVKALLVRGAHPDGRDQHGFTPLMHAALHSQIKIFQMLVSRGADPTIRSLSGYTAMDVAPVETHHSLQQILWSTPRSRHARPNLRPRNSHTSLNSSTASWDISSASMYESEDWRSSDQSRPASRPASAVHRPDSMFDGDIGDKQETLTIKQPIYAPLPAAMAAWRNTLIMQVQQFHSVLQRNIAQVHFALIPLDLHEHADQDNEVLRRLATLLQTLNKTFPFLPTAPLEAVLPPAYSDLYPETSYIASDGIDLTSPPSCSKTKKAGRREKHNQNDETSIDTRSEDMRVKEVWEATKLIFLLCVPLLFILIVSILHAFGAFASTVIVSQQMVGRAAEVPLLC